MWWWRRHAVSGEELSTHLDGRLAEADVRRVEAHLQVCEACGRRLEELRATVRALGSLASLQVPRSFTLRLEQVRPAPTPRPVRAYRYAGAVSTLALAVFLALVATDLSSLGGAPREPGEVATLQSAPEAAGAPAADSSGAQPTPGVAQAMGPGAAVENGEAEATPAARAAAPTAETPSTREEQGADVGRWVLRGFEAGAGAVFLAALFVVVRRRYRQRGEPVRP